MSDTACGYINNSISIKATDGSISQCCTIPPKKINSFTPSIHLEPFGGINNKEFFNVRESLNSGIKHPNCNKCWKMEDANSESYRMQGNSYIKEYNLLGHTRSSITYNDIYWIDIFLGNKCNLACRMCSPYNSSLIAKQLKLSRQAGKNLAINDETVHKIFDIIAQSPNLKHINLMGGEPLIIDFHDMLCEHLISSNRAKEIELRISTNLQVDFVRKTELHRHFKNISMSVSIDGVGDTYEYIRWPGNWEKLKTNLVLLTDPKLTMYKYGISMVLQNLLVDNLYESITTLQQLPNMRETNIYFHPVDDKNFMHILPSRIIQAELEKLDSLENLDGLKQSLKMSLEQSKNLKLSDVVTFFNQQKLYDGLRNQNLFQTKPHFLELAEQFNITPW